MNGVVSWAVDEVHACSLQSSMIPWAPVVLPGLLRADGGRGHCLPLTSMFIDKEWMDECSEREELKGYQCSASEDIIKNLTRKIRGRTR